MSEDYLQRAAAGIEKAKPYGRPATMDDQTLADVCEIVAAGKSIRQAGEQVGVTLWSILRYVSADENRERVFSLARQASGESHASMIIDKAMELLEAPDDLNQAQVQAIRTALDALKWTAARLHHRHWGEHKTTTLDLSGNFVNALEKVEQAAGKIKRERAIEVDAA